MNRLNKRFVVLAVLLLVAFVFSVGANAETGTTNIVAYVQVPVHVHDFTFSSSGNMLIAVCKNADSKCDLPECKVSLTLIAPEAPVYDGNAKEASLPDVEKEAWTNAGLELPVIVYTAAQGSELTEGKPVLPGSYTASITAGDVTASVTFTITGKTETPIASPAAGTYTGTQHVTLSTDTEDASIYYTTDGTTPTTSSIKYSEPVIVDRSMTLKAITIRSNWADSDVLEAVYVINSQSIPVMEVVLTPGTLMMVPGESRTLTALISPENATDKNLTWTSSDDSIATVGANGNVTAISEGTVIISAIASNDVTGTATVEIRKTPIVYQIIQGAKQVVYQNAESATFTSNADFSKFVRVEVDGRTVATRYYTARSGSTVITLNKEYLSNLSTGVHTLRIVSNDGSAATTFRIEKPFIPPKTGDSAMPTLWLVLGLLSLVTVLLLGRKTIKF